MNRKSIRPAVMILLCLALIFVTIPANASEAGNSLSLDAGIAEITSREEAVYAILDGDCSIENIYVVNILNISKSGVFTDYGNYSSVKNLTSAGSIVYDAGTVTAYVSEGRFYYQGTPETMELPWNISATYYLDGVLTPPDALAGKSGRLEIVIETGANSRVNPVFYENYLLQISLTLNTGKCTNISAPGASLANAGSNKIITFTAMPGNESKATVSADITDFEMDGISVNAVPFSMNVDIDTSALGGELGSLEEAIALLNNGVTELRSGIKQLSDGANAFQSGSSEFKSGIDALSGNAGELTFASKSILDALRYIGTGISESGGDAGGLQALAQLPTGLTQLAGGLDEAGKGIPELNAAFSQAVSALDSAFMGIPDSSVSEENIQALFVKNPGNETLKVLAENYAAVQMLKAVYNEISPVFAAVSTNLQVLGESIGKISSELNAVAGQIGTALETSDISSSVTQLSEGLTELTENYLLFHEGLDSYLQGMTQLSAAYSELHTGSVELAGGMNELYVASGLLNDGTEELYSQTAGLSGQMGSAIEEVLAEYDKSGFVPESFVSEQNKNTEAVQFVIQTKKIAKEKALKEETPDSEPENFWSRLKALF